MAGSLVQETDIVDVDCDFSGAIVTGGLMVNTSITSIDGITSFNNATFDSVTATGLRAENVSFDNTQWLRGSLANANIITSTFNNAAFNRTASK